ncbi:MAG: isopentenyl phosphate kinase [Methanosarcinales archaeon Met12]|nr:MAG: isopentenyl phosphate kinase [Methanosarcinales archaeon Met12]
MSDRIILKVGGSVLTDKTREKCLNVNEIDRVAGEIASANVRGLIIVHGAGSFGHPQAKKFGLDVSGKRNFIEVALTHEIVKELNRALIERLVENGVAAVPVHPLSCTISHSSRLSEMMIRQIELMLENGTIPVLHGDVVMDTAWGVSILSGDQIVVHLARHLGVGKVGVGTDVDGVMGGNKVIATITPKTFNDVKALLSGSSGIDVTGGMLGKVNELIKLADDGISSHIFNASKTGNIANFLNGKENFGTIIRSERHETNL